MKDQPQPIANDSTPLWDLVLADIHERDIVGAERYGTRLQALNGRDFLTDAYEEALDKIVYLRGCIEERKRIDALITGLVNMIESGRLTAADIPDDFKWLCDAMARVGRAVQMPEAQ